LHAQPGWFIVAGNGLMVQDGPFPETLVPGEMPMSVILTDWLSEKVSIKQAEAANLSEGRPFGYQHLKWERLKSHMIPGDELWEFCSPEETWVHLKGRQGYAVVRNGEIVDSIITSMS
jgi:hypothetical protein